MRSINMHQLRGNVGSVDHRLTSDDTPVLNFTIATNDRYTNQTTGEIIDRTDWHRVAAFGRVAERIHKLVRIGDYVYVSGPVKRGSYEKEGTTIPTAEIRLSGQMADFQLIARKTDRIAATEDPSASESASKEATPSVTVNDSNPPAPAEVPF